MTIRDLIDRTIKLKYDTRYIVVKFVDIRDRYYCLWKNTDDEEIKKCGVYVSWACTHQNPTTSIFKTFLEKIYDN